MKTSRTIALACLVSSLVVAGCSPSKATPGHTPAPAPAAPPPAARPAAPAAGWDAAKGPEHPIFRLTDNRLLAHVQRRGGLVVPVGEPGFGKYILSRAASGWQTGVVEDGKKVAVVTRPVRLEVPLAAGQQEGAKLFLRVAAKGAARLRAKVNGSDAGLTQLTAGWQTVAVAVPASAFVAGENSIELIPGARLAIAWLAVGKEAPEDDPGPLHDGQGGLLLPPGGGLAWYVALTRPGVAVSAQAVAKGTCTLRVRVTPGAGTAIDRAAPAAGPIRVDLSSLKGQIARLDLGAEGAGCQGVVLKDGALTLPGTAPQVTYPKRPKHILFWLADSFRADKLPPYNPKTRVEMPNLTAVAKRGIPFWGYSQGNESRASHGSIWTSNYVVNHRMYLASMHLKPSFTTIPRALKPSGLYTACYTANGYISKHWGFGEGWSFFRNNLHEGGGIMANDMARWVNGFIDKKADTPFFLYMGTIDGHVSWRGHQPWLDRYDTKPYKGPFEKWCSGKALEAIIAGRMKITERDKVRIRALYDSALSFGDEQYGTVLAKLKEKGIFDDTMLIINADHGDEFWEKGRVGHGGSIRQTMVQVPLIVSYPPLLPPGRLDDTGADAVDLLPTMCDALGVPIPKDAQGESLIPVAQGALAGYPRPSFTTQYEIAWAMRLGRYKLMLAGGKAGLYDVVADPGEDHDLWATRPIERRHIADAMAFMLLYQSKWRKTRWGVASNQRPEFAADLEAGKVRPQRAGAQPGGKVVTADAPPPRRGRKRR